MAKEVGAEALGRFFTDGKVRSRREWRGFKDTFYDYTRWLYIMKQLAGFIIKPRNIKAMFRYRWMANYLAVPMMVDKHTQGLRGPYLRMCHLEQDLVVYDVAKLLDNLFRGDRRIGNDEEFSKKVVLVDENEMTAVMMGFPTLKGLSRETPSTYVSVLLNQTAALHYIDVAQEYGLAGDVCPMPEAELGVSIDDDAPILGACAVQCNTTCDGSLMGNGIEARSFKIPTFQLAVPIRHRQESVQEYAAEEVINAIHFIEEQTGEKFNWDAFFKSMKRFNAETEEFLEWMEISKTDYPQVMGVTLALYRYGVYQAAGGRNQAFLDMDKKLTRMAMEGYKKKELAAREYRHRAMTWGVQAAYYTALPIWLLNCWGIVTITDMLSMVSTEMVNTEDKHQAMLDLAYLYENMIMRNRSNGGYETGVEALWRYCEMFNIDIVIMYVHMGCKSMSGYHGLFEEEARKHGVHLIWVTHNLMCPEDGSRRDMRTEINRYMRTVFREEPLDPTLEDFDDKQNW